MPRKAIGVTMPRDIRQDPVQSQIWKAIAPPKNTFQKSDLPTLRLLCYWHAAALQAQEAIALSIEEGDAALANKNPALSNLKEASVEIRLLSDALLLTPSARARIREKVEQAKPENKNAQVLSLVLGDRAAKEKKIAGV